MKPLAMQFPTPAKGPNVVSAIQFPTARASIDARLLPDIIELYLTTKRRDGVIAARTEKAYRHHLAPWIAYWSEHAAAHDHMLAPAVFNAALLWMQTTYRNRRKRSPQHNSIAHCWTVLRQALTWAYQQNCTGNVNLADWCPAVAYVDPNVHFPTADELARIMAQPAGEHRLRDVAVIAFLVSTGARRFEAAHASIATLTFAVPLTNVAVGDNHGGWLILKKVKGDKEGKGIGRPVAFCPVAGLLLKVYLRSVGRMDGTLFDMSDNAIGQMIDRHAHAAGVPLVSPHGFRRMLADYWDEVHGLSGRAALKRQLGHSAAVSDVTERHYISKNQKRVAREILRWHVSPLAEISLDWTLFPVHIP